MKESDSVSFHLVMFFSSSHLSTSAIPDVHWQTEIRLVMMQNKVCVLFFFFYLPALATLSDKEVIVFLSNKEFQKTCQNDNIYFLSPLVLHSSVYLIANIRWRPCDGRGLPHPPPTENWHQSSRQCRWLPGKPSCSLEPRNRHGACSQTGWHKFKVVYFSINRLANAS